MSAHAQSEVWLPLGQLLSLTLTMPRSLMPPSGLDLVTGVEGNAIKFCNCVAADCIACTLLKEAL